MKYFQDCTTIEEVKNRYRKLAFQHHPDLGGSTATMQEINNEYEKAIQQAKTGKKASTDEWIKEQEMASDYRQVIDELIKMKGIEIELCGLWLWITGETKQHKDQLKAAGCKYAAKKKCWYWKPENLKYRKKRKGELSMNEIRNHFGSQKVHAEEEQPRRQRETTQVNSAPTLFG